MVDEFNEYSSPSKILQRYQTESKILKDKH